MYFIVVKFQTKPDYTERFMDLVDPFTTATRKEPGNLWFDWSRSVQDPAEFVLVEAFEERVEVGSGRGRWLGRNGRIADRLAPAMIEPLRRKLQQTFSAQENYDPVWERELDAGDDAGYFAHDSAVWVVHGGMSPIAAGIRALLTQALHPALRADARPINRTARLVNTPRLPLR